MLIGTAAFAQTPANKVRGKVVEITDTSVVVEEPAGRQTVVLAEATLFRQANAEGKGFRPATRGDLAAGAFVSVTLEPGEAKVAKNVWIAQGESQLAAAFAAGKPAAGATTAPASQPATFNDTTVGRIKTGNSARRFLELHDEYVARAKKGDIDIVFLGDSITQGWNKAPDLWKARYEPLKAVNFGISGDVIQHVLWRIENGELDGINPKVIVLMVGTNNSARKEPEPLVRGIGHMVNVIRQKCPQSKVLLLAIFPRAKPTDTVHSATIAGVNAELPKLADGKHVVFLDINKHFLDESGKVRADLMPDLLHPGPAGYQVWADAMQPTLDAMLKD